MLLCCFFFSPFRLYFVQFVRFGMCFLPIYLSVLLLTTIALNDGFRWCAMPERGNCCLGICFWIRLHIALLGQWVIYAGYTTCHINYLYKIHSINKCCYLHLNFSMTSRRDKSAWRHWFKVESWPRLIVIKLQNNFSMLIALINLTPVYFCSLCSR